MAPEKEGGRTRRKGNAKRGDNASVGRTVEKKAGQGEEVTVVDVDPWGSFFEKFWGQAAGGESADRHDGGRKPAKGTRTTSMKPGRQGRSPRAATTLR
jgi:hypothetical protein